MIATAEPSPILRWQNEEYAKLSIQADCTKWQRLYDNDYNRQHYRFIPINLHSYDRYEYLADWILNRGFQLIFIKAGHR